MLINHDYIPLEYVKKIGTILVDIGGANPKILKKDSDFLMYLTDNRSKSFNIEYRFMGHLGYGGKFRTSHNSWTVDCYSESSTKDRKALIRQINQELKVLYDQYMVELTGVSI